MRGWGAQPGALCPCATRVKRNSRTISAATAAAVGTAKKRERRLIRAYVGVFTLTGHQWQRPICSAWAKSRNRPCRRRVVMRPDGRPHTVCRSHGGLTPPYEDRPISEAGKQRISAAARAMWQRYRRDKALGLPTPKIGRPKRQAATPRLAKWQWEETPEQRRERVLQDLRRRFPDGGF